MPQEQTKGSFGSYAAVAVIALLIGRCSVTTEQPTSAAATPVPPTIVAAPQALLAAEPIAETKEYSSPNIMSSGAQENLAEDEQDVYYPNCSAARAAGAAPVHAGDPGYAPHLDRDDDGVGCE